MFTSINRRRRPLRRRTSHYRRTRKSRYTNPWLSQVAVTVVATLCLGSVGMAVVHGEIPTTNDAIPPSVPVPTQPVAQPPSEPSAGTPPSGDLPSVPGDEVGSSPAQLPDGYSYLDTMGGKPVLVVACQPVSYHLDTAQIPSGGQSVVNNAIALASQMTGITASIDDAHSSGTTITIAYKHESEDSSLAGPAIGVAHVSSTGNVNNTYISHVNISLEIEWFDSAIQNTPDLATMVALHEILHGNGLDHVDDPNSIMYYSARATAPSANDVQAARALNPGCPIQSGTAAMGTTTGTISVPANEQAPLR